MYCDIDIYTEIVWILSQVMVQKKMYKEGENWESLIHLENFHLFGEHY